MFGANIPNVFVNTKKYTRFGVYSLAVSLLRFAGNRISVFQKPVNGATLSSFQE